ncbi:MAG: hypothetical protein SGPRY_004980, partial [Prymnesium sp.]
MAVVVTVMAVKLVLKTEGAVEKQGLVQIEVDMEEVLAVEWGNAVEVPEGVVIAELEMPQKVMVVGVLE